MDNEFNLNYLTKYHFKILDWNIVPNINKIQCLIMQHIARYGVLRCIEDIEGFDIHHKDRFNDALYYLNIKPHSFIVPKRNKKGFGYYLARKWKSYEDDLKVFNLLVDLWWSQNRGM